MSTRRLVSSALILISVSAVLSSPAVAHDVWLRPVTSESPAAGDLVKIDLWQGHSGEAERLTRNERKLERLQALGPSGEVIDLPGVHAFAPAGVFRPPTEGLWSVVYEGRPSPYRLPAQRFARYLEEEGLDHVAEARRERGEESEEGRELVSRSLKALVRVGSVASLRDRVIGLPVEIVLEGAVDGRFDFRLIAGGEPSPGVLVDLQRLDSGSAGPVMQARTSEEGVVSFWPDPGPSSEGATWMVAAVVVEPGLTPDGSWRTFFSTLTFPALSSSMGSFPAHSVMEPSQGSSSRVSSQISFPGIRPSPATLSPAAKPSPFNPRSP